MGITCQGKGLLCAIILISTVAAFSTTARADINLADFQLNGIAVSQGGGNNSYSGQVSWTPYFGLGLLGIRGLIGATLLKTNLGDKYIASDYQALLTLSVFPLLAIEAGGGLEIWHGNGGSAPVASMNLCLGLFGFIDRIFVGYSRFFLKNAGANEFKAGVGINL